MALTEDKLAATLGALELGVVPPDQSVDEALATLSPADARKTKRKFRKMWRRALLGHGTRVDRRQAVAAECRRLGMKIINSR